MHRSLHFALLCAPLLGAPLLGAPLLGAPLLGAQPILAQSEPARRPNTLAAAGYAVGPATGTIEVDGRIDEPAWLDAAPIPLEYEWFPGDNTRPPVETECRMTHDTGNLYVSCRASDSRPGSIRAHYADRDDVNRIAGDDHIIMLLDPFNDQRRGFQFRVNAVGVQADALFTTAEGIEDFSWDAIWASAGRIDDNGYAVELRIPFQSLRFPEMRGEQTWGVILERSHPRSTRRRMRSMPTDRNNACLLCQSNKMTGFSGIAPGGTVELFPTATSRRTDLRTAFPAGSLASGDVEFDPGLDVRWGLTSNLSLNATANPDFSQVEADVAQLDANTRFALFFPERRPFFLEGADFFATPIQAVFTRTVADPTGGLKFTGKGGSSGFNIFSAHDRVANILFPANQGTADTSLTSNTLTTAIRYRRDLGQASYVGALYTGRESFGSYSNRVAGLDAFLQLSAANSVRLQALGSETQYPAAVAQRFSQPAEPFAGLGFRGSFLHASADWIATLALEELSPDFRADAGFVPRVDLRSADGSLTRTIFGRPGQPFTQLQFGATANARTDHEWQLTDRSAGTNVFYLGPAQTSVFLEGFQDRERLGTANHNLTRARLTIGTQPWGSARFGLLVRIGDELDVANNRAASNFALAPSAEVYLGRSLNVNVRHDFQRLAFRGTRVFTANLLQTRVIYHLDVRTFVRAIVQWERLDRNTTAYALPVTPSSSSLFTQLLFSYKLNPQTVAFVGYSDTHFGDDATDLTRASRTFFVKLGYALRP